MGNRSRNEDAGTHTYKLPTAMVVEKEVGIPSPRHDS